MSLISGVCCSLHVNWFTFLYVRNKKPTLIMPKILGTTIQTSVDQVGGTCLCNCVINITFDRKLAEFFGQQYNWVPVYLLLKQDLALWSCLIRHIAVGCFTIYKEDFFSWWSMHHIGKQFVVLRKLLFQSQTPKGGYASWIKYKAHLHTSLCHHIAFNREIGMVYT